MFEWLRFKPKPLVGRLTQEQVVEIARAAVDQHSRHSMGLPALVHIDQALVWKVGSVAFGSGVLVTIDDATGEVLDVARWGVR